LTFSVIFDKHFRRNSPVNKEKQKLLDLVDLFPQKKIAVWGDFILDEYIYGTTKRISREAPVIILSYKDKEIFLGGAGNALLNLKALESIPYPIGIIGQDSGGKKILKIVKKNSIPTDFMLQLSNFSTPVKTRILAGEETTRKQQMLRIDREEKVPETKTLQNKIKRFLNRVRSQVDALLISDYNYLTAKKDVYDEVLKDFKKDKTPVTLDSRFRLLDFKGATISTPNEPEVEEALKIKLNDDLKTVKKTGKTLLLKSRSKAVLITRGAKGMVLFEGKKQPFLIPIQGTTDIVDVTGAGDTVISILTLALASGATFREAALLANYAASVVVMKKGAATLSPKELKLSIIS
jgi:rfaE bifunctional protein kinase chain/domain